MASRGGIEGSSADVIRADLAAVLSLGERAIVEGWAIGRFRAGLATIAAPLPATVSNDPAWVGGRRPAFWPDLPVRSLIISLHREVPLADARAACLAQFGAARTPSRSAIGRCWKHLDRIANTKG